jgi:glycine/D-amino acid oxidase-like deaminating enzyme
MVAGATDTPSRVATSLWRALNPPFPESAPVGKRAETDVLIVGAGVAGLSLGLHLASRRIETFILEAAHQPDAATASSAGIVAPQLVRATPSSVLKRLGTESGGRLLRMIAESGHYTFDLVRHYRIECAAIQSGFLNPMSGAKGARRQAQIVAEWKPFRNDLTLAGAVETAELSGCRGYASAIVDSSGGGLDPVAYSAGLARAAHSSGAKIYCDSPVQSVARVGNRWVAHTPGGDVTARRVFLCANGGNADLHPALAQTILPLRVCEVATLPVPESIRRHILPRGHVLTDSSTNVFSIRFDRAGRLITACPGRQELLYEDIHQVINRRLEATIPAYRAMQLEYVWQGTAWLNTSLLPRVLLVDEGLMAVQSCNGRGIALNTIIGRELARYVETPNSVVPLVPIERPKPVTGFWLVRHLPRLMMAGPSIAKRMLERLRAAG